MEQLKLSKGFRLNKIINEEELTKQLTFPCGVQMLPRILLLTVYKIIDQATPSFIRTWKIIGKSNAVKESGGGGTGRSWIPDML